MILDLEIKTITAQNWKYYRSLGYNTTYGGDILFVKIEHLPLYSHKKLECRCDLCGVSFKREAYRLLKRKMHHCYPCQRKFLGYLGKGNAIKAGKKNCGINHHNFNPNKKEIQKYSYQVRILSEKTYNENLDVINPDKLPRTLCGIEGGYQLDHKISIKQGYENNIPVEEMAKLENLQILPWQENREKWYKYNTKGVNDNGI